MKRRGALKKTLLAIVGVFLLFSGCFLDGGLGHGKTVQAEVTSSGPRLSEALADAETKLLEAGIPVEGSFRCVEMKLKSGDITVVEATASGRFDPVMAVVDKDGVVLAANDDWGRDTGSRIVLSQVPSGARLLVWGVNGFEGVSTVSVSAGTSGDLDDWTASATLTTGVMESRLLDGKRNDTMQDFVDDLRAGDVYVSDWENAVLVPFRVTEPGFHYISLESDDFDAYLVLVSIERGTARYLAMNDDGGTGWNSRLMRELEPGLYAAVVNSYSGRDGGRYTLSVAQVELGEGEINRVSVPGSYDAYISGGELAMAFWPGIDQDWHCSSINSATPVAAFGFTITQDGLYNITATSDIDATLTLLSYESPENAYCVDYNDDYDGWDPGLLLNLEPGTYLALVAFYDQVSQGAVSFTIEQEVAFEAEAVDLGLGSAYELRLDRRTPYGLFNLDITGGYNYAISAESAHLDPMITLIFPDGSELFDDDGGEGLDSYLEFVPNAEQLGAAILRVETYYGDGDGIITVAFQQLDRLSDRESFSLYD